MDQYFLSPSGVKIPKMIYGTAWKKSQTADYVSLALKEGFRGVDTACQPKHYNEPLVGVGLARAYGTGIKREDLFIQTKFTPYPGQDPNDCPYDPQLPLVDQIRGSLKCSLENLKTDYLDSLLLHSPLATSAATLEAWRTLESFVESRSVRIIGISNCYDPHLLAFIFEKAKIKPAVVQNRFYLDSDYDKDIRAFCHKNNIFYQCFWTLKANGHVLESPAMEEIARDKKRTPAEIFFRCLLQLNIHPLIGSTSPQHLREDLSIFDFSLTNEECEMIGRQGPFYLPQHFLNFF